MSALRVAAITAITAIVAIVALGCGAGPKRTNTLIEDVRGYNDGLRWGKYAAAALRVPPAQRESFLDERELAGEDLRVVDVETTRVRFRDERQRARVDVKFTWHLDSRGIIHETVSRQHWELFGKVWLVTSEYRIRGEPMPGLPEAEPDEDPDVVPLDAPEAAEGTAHR